MGRQLLGGQISIKYNTDYKCQKPQPQHWSSFAVGGSDFNFVSTVSVRDNFIRIELIVDGKNAKDIFSCSKISLVF